MFNKKLLILGAAYYQVPIIKEAVKQDFYVVTTSYLADDPGHKYSHKSFIRDISDTDAIYELARQIGADLVLPYVSETAVRTAAKVNKQLGYPWPDNEAVLKMTRKDNFRKWQKNNGFHFPKFVVIHQKAINTADLGDLSYPLIVKPVDSSGSRGVSYLENEEKYIESARYALSYSESNRIILEEIIVKKGPQITGDGYIWNGRVQFLFLGDHHYNTESIFPVAYATTWPSSSLEKDKQRVSQEAERLLSNIGYRNGPFNIDARIGIDGHIYIVEIAPRNGANFVSKCTYYCTGVHLDGCLLHQIRGIQPDFEPAKEGLGASYIIHSKKKGIFRGLRISDKILPFIRYKYISVNEGELVNNYRNLADALGIILLGFDNYTQMIEIITSLHADVRVQVEVLGKTVEN